MTNTWRLPSFRPPCIWLLWLLGCGAHCMACSAVGTSVTCTSGMCESGYALNSDALDVNSACVGKLKSCLTVTIHVLFLRHLPILHIPHICHCHFFCLGVQQLWRLKISAVLASRRSQEFGGWQPRRRIGRHPLRSRRRSRRGRKDMGRGVTLPVD